MLIFCLFWKRNWIFKIAKTESMAFRFEELIIWQRAFQLANEIDFLSDDFPKKEMYSLSSQIKRAADSVV